MKRSGPPRRRTPLRRMSEKRRSRVAGSAEIRRSVIDRDRRQCSMWMHPTGLRCEGRLEVHHIRRRSQGGGDEMGNLMTVSSACHRYIHDHPEWAYEHGFLARTEANK